MKTAVLDTRRAVPLLVWGLVVLAGGRAAAVPRDFAIFPLGIRSAGMGETGTADHFQVANVAHNPALVAKRQGAQAAWGRSEVSFVAADVKLDGGVVGTGYQWRSNGALTLGGGLVFSYARERWGLKDLSEETADEPEWGPYDEAYLFGAAAAVGYRRAVQLGVGVDVKPRKWDNHSEQSSQVIKGVVYDAGVDVGVVLMEKRHHRLTASVGFAYFNFGGEMKSEAESIYLPKSTDEYNPPEYRRYGVNLTFESPSWKKAEDALSILAPAVSVSLNYDILDHAYWYTDLSNRHMVGGEVAVLQVLFLRGGYIKQDNINSYQRDLDDATFGVGVAVPFGRFHLEFDYARRDFRNYDAHQDSYGLVLDAAF